MTREAIRFYFSFRSPDAWLASEPLDEDLGDLWVPRRSVTPATPARGNADRVSTQHCPRLRRRYS